MAVRHWQNHSQELLTDPDCAPESAKSVSTSRTAHMHLTEYLILGKILLLSLTWFYHAWLNLPIPHE